MRRKLTRTTIAGFIIVLGEPLLLQALKPALSDRGITLQVGVGLVAQWLAALLILAVVLLWERRPPEALGLRRFVPIHLAWGIGGFVVSTVGITLTFPLISALGLDSLEDGVRRLAVLPLALRLAIPLSAGITEEILFRGFLIERLSELTGRMSTGALTSWLVFTALHVPFWGVGGALQIGVASAVFCLTYAICRSVVPCIVIHVLNDAWAFLIVPMFIPEFP